MKTFTTTLAIAAACLSVLTYATKAYACGEMAEIGAPTTAQLDALRAAAEKVDGATVLTIPGVALGQHFRATIVEVDTAGRFTLETHGDADTVLFLYDANNRLIAAINDIDDPMVETAVVDEFMAKANASLPEDQQIDREQAAQQMLFWVLYRCCWGESFLSSLTLDLEPGEYLAVVGDFHGAPAAAGLTVSTSGADLASEAVESLNERIADAQAKLRAEIVAELSATEHEIAIDAEAFQALEAVEPGMSATLATLDTTFGASKVVVIRFTVTAPKGQEFFSGSFELLNMETPEDGLGYPTVSIFDGDGNLVSRYGVYVEPGTYFAVISGATWFPNGITVNLSSWNQG